MNLGEAIAALFPEFNLSLVTQISFSGGDDPRIILVAFHDSNTHGVFQIVLGRPFWGAEFQPRVLELCEAGVKREWTVVDDRRHLTDEQPCLDKWCHRYSQVEA